MGVPILAPLYIYCRRHGCGQKRQVPTRTRQRTQQFCSKRCGCLSRMNLMRAAQSRGGKMKASRARALLMVKIGHLTPVEAFRIGYVRGLASKWRQTRERLKGAA